MSTVKKLAHFELWTDGAKHIAAAHLFNFFAPLHPKESEIKQELREERHGVEILDELQQRLIITSYSSRSESASPSHLVFENLLRWLNRLWIVTFMETGKKLDKQTKPFFGAKAWLDRKEELSRRLIVNFSVYIYAFLEPYAVRIRKQDPSALEELKTEKMLTLLTTALIVFCAYRIPLEIFKLELADNIEPEPLTPGLDAPIPSHTPLHEKKIMTYRKAYLRYAQKEAKLSLGELEAVNPFRGQIPELKRILEAPPSRKRKHETSPESKKEPRIEEKSEEKKVDGDEKDDLSLEIEKQLEEDVEKAIDELPGKDEGKSEDELSQEIEKELEKDVEKAIDELPGEDEGKAEDKLSQEIEKELEKDVEKAIDELPEKDEEGEKPPSPREKSPSPSRPMSPSPPREESSYTWTVKRPEENIIPAEETGLFNTHAHDDILPCDPLKTFMPVSDALVAIMQNPLPKRPGRQRSNIKHDLRHNPRWQERAATMAAEYGISWKQWDRCINNKGKFSEKIRAQRNTVYQHFAFEERLLEEIKAAKAQLEPSTDAAHTLAGNFYHYMMDKDDEATIFMPVFFGILRSIKASGDTEDIWCDMWREALVRAICLNATLMTPPVNGYDAMKLENDVWYAARFTGIGPAGLSEEEKLFMEGSYQDLPGRRQVPKSVRTPLTIRLQYTLQILYLTISLLLEQITDTDARAMQGKKAKRRIAFVKLISRHRLTTLLTFADIYPQAIDSEELRTFTPDRFNPDYVIWTLDKLVPAVIRKLDSVIDNNRPTGR